jgi:hypothetical protein
MTHCGAAAWLEMARSTMPLCCRPHLATRSLWPRRLAPFGRLAVGDRVVVVDTYRGHPWSAGSTRWTTWRTRRTRATRSRQAVAGFVHSYNTQWLIGRLGHRTPKPGRQGRHHNSSVMIRQTSKLSDHPGAVQGQRIGAIFACAVHSHELGMGDRADSCSTAGSRMARVSGRMRSGLGS